MARDPLTGDEIGPNEQTVRCPRNHINLAQSWRDAGNRCSYPGCGYVGEPIVTNSIVVPQVEPNGNLARSWWHTWFVLFLVIILIWIGMVVAPLLPDFTPINSSSALTPSEQELLSFNTLIVDYLIIKQHSLESLDGSASGKVLSGTALHQHLSVITGLQAVGCHVITTDSTMTIDSYQFIEENTVLLDVTIEEDTQLVCRGQPVPRLVTGQPSKAKYRIEKIDGQWLITSTGG